MGYNENRCPKCQCLARDGALDLGRPPDGHPSYLLWYSPRRYQCKMCRVEWYYGVVRRIRPPKPRGKPRRKGAHILREDVPTAREPMRKPDW